MHKPSILEKVNVLSLNALWQRIGTSTVADAFVAMNGGGVHTPAALGVDMGYAMRDDGTWDFVHPLYMNPIKWDEWVTLPIRPFDEAVNTAKLRIRVPTVIVSPAYLKMPTVEPAPTRDNIYDRDKGICQISGQFVGREGGNIEHPFPKGRGGAHRTWENQVWASERLNSLKRDRTLEEMGWKLIRKPVAPKRVPISVTLRECRHPDWRHFMEN